MERESKRGRGERMEEGERKENGGEEREWKRGRGERMEEGERRENGRGGREKREMEYISDLEKYAYI
eukprot:136060-Amorphochlora_amoeboformis.AAC.1